LVDRMRAGALRAEPVEHRNAERADEIAVGAAGRGDLVEVQPERPTVLAGALEQDAGALAALERRPRPTAFDHHPRARCLGLDALTEGVAATAVRHRRP